MRQPQLHERDPIDVPRAARRDVATPAPPAARFVALDGVRGVAAIAVVLFHFSEFSGEPWLPRAWLAVDTFVCLSGFVIAHSYQRKIAGGMTFAEFFRRRMSRLYPLYLFGLSIGAIAFVATAADPPGYTVASFLKTFALGLLVLPSLHELAPAHGPGHVADQLFPFNGPSWSMFFELVANAAFFVLLACGVRRLRWIIGACAVLCPLLAGVAGGLNAGWGASTFVTGFPRVGYSFFVGVALYRLHDVARVGRPGIGLIGVALMLLVYVLPESRVVSVAGFLALGPVVVWANAAVQPAARLAAACRWLGGISYPLYIIHVPVFHGLSLLGPWPAPTWAVIIGKAAIAIALAWGLALLDDALRARLTRGGSPAPAPRRPPQER